MTRPAAGGAVERVEGIAVVLMRDNIDTDAIMPSVGVRAAGTDVAALAPYLFHEWRNDPGTGAIAGFPLDRPEFAGARILVSGANFGCGSSREHAVWALKGHGIHAVVAASFGEIFAGNCVRNGVVPARVDASDLHRVADAADSLAGTAAMTVDLVSMTISAPGLESVGFQLDPTARTMLLSGSDEIDATLRHLSSIREFQRRHASLQPWIYDCAPGAVD
ncbi:MAG: 3-isopropylmalate dehydratase small subunit [Burkholderiaceae bacterium]|nr:3-isopropylmalate dehydratase small subunit [Burkholderiaceae bacterium]